MYIWLCLIPAYTIGATKESYCQEQKIHTYVLYIKLLMTNQMTYDELHQTQSY